MVSPGRLTGDANPAVRDSQPFAGTSWPSGYWPVTSVMLFWLLCVGTSTREKASVPRAISPLRLGALAIHSPASPWSSMSISMTWPASGGGPLPPPQPAAPASATASASLRGSLIMRATLPQPALARRPRRATASPMRPHANKALTCADAVSLSQGRGRGGPARRSCLAGGSGPPGLRDHRRCRGRGPGPAGNHRRSPDRPGGGGLLVQLHRAGLPGGGGHEDPHPLG